MTTVKIDIDDLKLWQAVVGSDFANMSDFLSGINSVVNFDEPSPLGCVYTNVTGDKLLVKTITTCMLAKAYGKALQEGQAHCGGRVLALDDPDSCFAYYILQYALYGRVVFD